MDLKPFNYMDVQCENIKKIDPATAVPYHLFIIKICRGMFCGYWQLDSKGK